MNTPLLTPHLIGLVACALLAPSGPARAASVTVSLPKTEAAKDSQIQVAVSFRQAQGLGPLQLDLRYDPIVLQFVNASEGRGAAIGLFDSNLLEPGNLRLAMTGDPNQPIQGDGELFLLTFKLVGAAGQESVLNAENVRAWEQSDEAFDMRVEVEPGAILVKSGAVSLWLIATSGGFLLVVAVLFAVLRKRDGTTPIGANQAASGGDPAKAVFCVSCGAKMGVAAKFCPACGHARGD